MKNILCMIACLGFIFNLHATSRDTKIANRAQKFLAKNLAKEGVWAVAHVKCVDGQLNITIIHPRIRPGFKQKNLSKKKRYYTKTTKELNSRSKQQKAKNHVLFQPVLKNFVNITTKKEGFIVNSGPAKQKNKPLRNRKNKLNRQFLYDKKMNWLNFEDYDDEIIIFNHKEMVFYEERNDDDRQMVLYEESIDEELEEEFCEEEYDYSQECLLRKYDKRQQRNYRLSSEKKNFL